MTFSVEDGLTVGLANNRRPQRFRNLESNPE